MTVATKLLKMSLSNILIDDEIFKRWKTIPVAMLICKHISSNGDVIKGDVIKVQCWKFREMVIYVTKYSGVEGVLETPTLH